MINTITFESKSYPKYQSEGNAAQFIIPFAKKVCIGTGYDIGFCNDEWKFPGAIGIDSCDNTNEYTAFNLPDVSVDYIFSSHCLEHLPNWVDALDYWISRLKLGGTLFLYLPHKSQIYWRPYHNKKHIHCLDCDIIKDYLQYKKMINIFTSGVDLNNSFAIMAEKNEI
jgi:predicted SAM-dependent methyltransferase